MVPETWKWAIPSCPRGGSRAPLVFREHAPPESRSLPHFCWKLGPKLYVTSGLGIPRVQSWSEKPGEVLPRKPSSFFSLLWSLPCGDVTSAPVNPGSCRCILPLTHPLILTLTSFLEECTPTLAADAQDQEAENDARGKLHPAAGRWADTNKDDRSGFLFLFLFCNVDTPLHSKNKLHWILSQYIADRQIALQRIQFSFPCVSLESQWFPVWGIATGFWYKPFPVRSSPISPETQLHSKFPKGIRSLGTIPLCNMRWGEQGTSIYKCLLYGSLTSHRSSIWNPYPPSIHSWWILIVRIVDSGRKQRAGLQHKNAGEERESPKRKNLESSSTSPLAVPSCWGSWQSWAACAACLGDGAGALYIDTWLEEQMRRQVWTKRKKTKQERKRFGKFLLTAFQNSSVILHTHLILLDCAIWQFSRV